MSTELLAAFVAGMLFYAALEAFVYPRVVAHLPLRWRERREHYQRVRVDRRTHDGP